mmetsp:Transcript_14792/g.31717  ORF Transcript_14792/g.31717 Transcript_14792/m.31717 type:complete len:674 (-) Transcript_14792:748-2769(-)|eukprot:CAMPEP_0185848458 /NCGR_PEP_ID=MMETSP1354-20130828/3322_1 /TAXON_ID=708628 /ORGANISM="Erythrolobus madagascarensis, Strain CCMP3276" /LENGTH=673 /DNA_ID=CAMNT_0028548851 /DNA_START=130 /DNA_END=2151 /DNA_ORIENTATION=+
MLAVTLSALESEVGEKVSRLGRLSARWVVTVVLVMVAARSGFLNEDRNSTSREMITMVPWLTIWVIKAVWDVVEDVLKPNGMPTIMSFLLASIALSAVAAVSVALPFSTCLPLSAMVTAMLLGSILSGGIDTPVWAAMGLIVSSRMWSSSSFLTSVSSLSRQDISAVLRGVVLVSFADALQDQFLARFAPSEAQNRVRAAILVDTVVQNLLKFKVFPIVVLLVVARDASFSGAHVAVQTALFALVSPHFVVYDAVKVLFCCALWLRCASLLEASSPKTSNQSGSHETVAGPFVDSARRVLLRSAAAMSGRQVHFASESSAAALVLRKSDMKGDGLERFLSRQAFWPLIPTESVDGTQWRRMRLCVVQILRTLRCDTIESRLAEQFGTCSVLDSEALHNALSCVLHELVFGERPSQETRLLWIQASIVWRGRIALKSRGNSRVLADAYCKALQLLSRASPKLRDALNCLQDEKERVSAVLQPFIISPLINISDGVVAVVSVLRENDALRADLLSATDPPMLDAVSTKIVLLALSYMPPFPILERQLPSSCSAGLDSFEAGSHVFVEADTFGRRLRTGHKCASEWIPFGLGPRACPGRTLGMQLLTGIVKHGVARLLSEGDDSFVCPERGHLYSGRHLDGVARYSRTEAIFQARMVSCALARAAYAALFRKWGNQ